MYLISRMADTISLILDCFALCTPIILKTAVEIEFSEIKNKLYSKETRKAGDI